MKFGWPPLLLLASSQAAIINISLTDSFAKMEAARAGDEVVIAPGTYHFRLYFAASGTADHPIIIRAQDPNNRPVWDPGSTLVESAPGSYTAGDRGRGLWQFSGASNYRISGIIIQNARTSSHNSAGIRYYNTSTNLYLSDCLFQQNDNGLTGGTQSSELTAEFCEFNQNGNTAASSSAPTHNIYIYGGKFALRYSYVHDPTQGQNFHVRAYDSAIEYNWFLNAKSYEGDLMSDDDIDAGPFTQKMLLRGNVFIQSTAVANHGQVIAVFNDNGTPDLSLSVRALCNTFVGAGFNSAFVHLSNADQTEMSAEISNNILSGTTRAALLEDSTTASFTGGYNWLSTTADQGPLTNTIRSAAPGFQNAAANNFTLASGSPCIGAATPVYALPGFEYADPRRFKIRGAARDLGAFESTSAAAAYGPYDPRPRPAMSIRSDAVLTWPLFAADYLLDEADSTFAWAPSPLPIATNLASFSAIPSQPRFFRLRQP